MFQVRNWDPPSAGYISGSEGDSLTVAFHNARDAALAARDIQEAMLVAAWWVF